ncbi:hypothetical protein DFQ30_010140 [Apophysomyces sp. BC1015]|nr:hypothetical protein DFQ30_010140 [Apophysomyces sp. BC1015]KAG0171175.1 hypothetical protein DFQ29_008967 [Apophysomyces sp. BC1021]
MDETQSARNQQLLFRWEENHLSSPRTHVPDLTLVGAGFTKPNGVSAGVYDDCSTALSTTRSLSTLAYPPRFMLSQHLKDDVFLAQPPQFMFPMTSACNEPSTNSQTTADLWPTPSVSPVSSPSDFLYNHEPLFDGIENFMDQPLADPGTGPDDGQALSTSSWAGTSPAKPVSADGDSALSTCASPELDWIALLEDFHDHPTHDFPTPSTTEESEGGDTNTECDDSDMDSRGRPGQKRVRSNSSDESLLHDSIDRLNLSDGDILLIQEKPDRKRPFKKTKPKRKVPKRPTTHRILYNNTSTTNCLQLANDGPHGEPTVFEQLTLAGIDWCRYCGTTEGVNWLVDLPRKHLPLMRLQKLNKLESHIRTEPDDDIEM